MIRTYTDEDYESLRKLYEHPDWFGGIFDEARDGRKRLADKVNSDPESLWLYERKGQLVGSISLVDDGRVAWFFRFVVKDNDSVVAKELYDKAVSIFKARGHSQVLAYSPVDEPVLAKRYADLGMTKGNSYTAYWTDI